MHSKFMSIAAAVAAVMVASCGGGGGGGETPSVSFGVQTLQASAFQNQQINVTSFQDATVSVDATTSGTLPGAVYGVVQDTGSGFAGSPIQLTETASGFRASLRPNATLAPGTYTGSLILHFCKDPGCAQEYPVPGSTLPYQVTILPQLEATVSVNGSQAGTVKSGVLPLPLSLADGDAVEIRSNVAMAVAYSSGPGFVTVAVDPSSTATDWKAVIARPAFPTTNQISLDVLPKDSTATIQMSAGVNVTMVP